MSQSSPGVEIAELRDLKRWTTYFSPKDKVHGIWWRTSRSLPSGVIIDMIIKDDEGKRVWQGKVKVAIDPAIESDDPGVYVIPETAWDELREKLPDLKFVATEAVRWPR